MNEQSNEPSDELRQRITELVELGEGQYTEFMREFPKKTHDLGKEIAAFATSNAATILIGVSEDGFSLVGVQMADRHEKDDYLNRIDRICCDTVKPAITPGVAFLEVAENRVVIVVDVPQGPEPVYYSSHIPYVRHLTSSRPATPEEVKDSVVRWHAGRMIPLPEAEEGPADAVAELAVEIAALLSDAWLYLETMDVRSINPHMQTMKFEFEVVADALKEAAVSDPGRTTEFKDDFIAVASKLGELADYRHALGSESWQGFLALGAEVKQSVDGLRSKLLARAGGPGNGEIAKELGDTLRTLLEVLDQVDSYDTEELLERLAREALVLGRLAFFLKGPEEMKEALEAVSRRLVLVEVGPGGMGWRFTQEGLLQTTLDELRQEVQIGLDRLPGVQ